jgi:Icc-related predicted phosphoesterase/uncharacterized protein YprB with RNaseH-like and TPR domain
MQVVKYSKKKPRIISKNKPQHLRIMAFSDWRVQNISDIYYLLKKYGPVDLILYAGDDLLRFVEDGLNHFTEFSKLTNYALVLAVVGNDGPYPPAKGVLKNEGIHDLYDQSVIIGDYAFIGLESSTKGPALFQHKEVDFANHLKTQFKYLKNKKLIILSHTPPFNILDLGKRFKEEDIDTHHIGSTALRKFLDNNEVSLTICGHCHLQGGMSTFAGGTMVINIASHDAPGSFGNVAIIEYDTGRRHTSIFTTEEIIPVDSPRRLRYVGPTRCEKLAKCGITSISQIANIENIGIASKQLGMTKKRLLKLRAKAKSLLFSEIYQIQPFVPFEKKPIFFDIETDVYRDKVWLIGFLIDDNFIQLFANNWEQEKEILARFIEVLKEHPDNMLVSYSTKNFDFVTIQQALERNELDVDFFKKYPHVDLGTCLSRTFIFPNQNYALKELGAFLGYDFKHADLDGLYVALNYMAYADNGEELDPRILEYNEDDVRVIPYLLEKALSLSDNVKKIVE